MYYYILYIKKIGELKSKNIIRLALADLVGFKSFFRLPDTAMNQYTNIV